MKMLKWCILKNKFRKINWFLTVFIFLFISFSSAGVIYFFMQNTQKSEAAVLRVNSESENSLIVTNDLAYRLKIDDVIHININDKKYNYIIKNILLDDSKEFVVKIIEESEKAPLLPNTKINVSFTNGEQKIYELFLK
ncbi:MAG1140 family protein [Mycoplasmopsis agassizii]|uniref:MAG1140 family protein n=1 Tax=Mycoplasmopsis agassizii TaxID=33922 RepID=UPI003528BFFF